MEVKTSSPRASWPSRGSMEKSCPPPPVSMAERRGGDGTQVDEGRRGISLAAAGLADGGCHRPWGRSPAVVGLTGGGGAATMRWGLREAAAALERAGGRGSAGDRVRCGGSGWIRMSERAI
jgi:hypothetical protein